MRLSESNIKNGILHPERDVRDVAISYFSGTSSDDRTIMPVAIDAVETYGWREAFSDMSVMESLFQNDDTVSWIVATINRPGDFSDPSWVEYLLDLSWILAKTNAHLLKRRRRDIFAVKLLNAEVREIICGRTRLLTVDKAVCWRNLEEFCAGAGGQPPDTDWNMDTAFHLVEALSRAGDKYADRVLSILSQPTDLIADTAEAWMRLFMIRLAGEMRLTDGIPHIVAELQRENADWVQEECMAALVSIGNDDVIKAIWNACALAPARFRCYTAWVLESIHTDMAMEAALHLFQREEDAIVKANFGETLLAQFSIDGVGAVRHFILNSPPDDMMTGLRNNLLVVCTLIGAEFPEFDGWRDEIRQDKAYREQWYNPEFPVIDTWTPQIAEPRRKSRVMSRPPSLFPRTRMEHIGRNAPCPCNSGKKYKHCCLRRSR